MDDRQGTRVTMDLDAGAESVSIDKITGKAKDGGSVAPPRQGDAQSTVKFVFGRARLQTLLQKLHLEQYTE